MDLCHKVGEQGGDEQGDSEQVDEDHLFEWAHHTYQDAEAHHSTSVQVFGSRTGCILPPSLDVDTLKGIDLAGGA